MENSGNGALRDLGIFYCVVYVVTLNRKFLGRMAILERVATGQFAAAVGKRNHRLGRYGAARVNSQGGNDVYGSRRYENKRMERTRA